MLTFSKMAACKNYAVTCTYPNPTLHDPTLSLLSISLSFNNIPRWLRASGANSKKTVQTLEKSVDKAAVVT